MSGATILLAGLLALGSGSGEEPAASCDAYEKLDSLPSSFKKIATGDLGYGDFAEWSDGHCTCDNVPRAQRKFAQRIGKPALMEGDFSCQLASPDFSKVQ